MRKYIFSICLVSSIIFGGSYVEATVTPVLQDDSGSYDQDLRNRIVYLQDWLMKEYEGNIYLGGYSDFGESLYLYFALAKMVDGTTLYSALYSISQGFKDFDFEMIVLRVGVPTPAQVKDGIIFWFFFTLEVKGEDIQNYMGVGRGLVKDVL